jgi:predicted short-subunit dehydrogenase-like oxidoreductase (DUF2520 family)
VETELRNIVIIGSGNVAWHLVNAFSSKGIRVLQILARNEKTARQISRAFSVPYITDPADMVRDAGLYILAVQDDQIQEASKRLHLRNQLLVHTSGFSSIEILAGASASTGVLWPLQTLTAGKSVDYSKIPFFIEGSNDKATALLTRFAGTVSERVITTDSPTRQKIHLAAVIASNLTNQLYAISASILERQDIPFDVLAPLILETAVKAGQQHPLRSQTGPASRKDLRVIEKHLELLRDDLSFRDIYRLITENIIHHPLK